MKKTAPWAGLGLACFSVLLFLYSCRKQNDELAPAFPLHVIATTPTADEENSFYGQNVLATLNAALDTSRYNVSFSIWQDEVSVPGALAIEDNVLRFVPEADLLPLQVYRASVRLTQKGDSTAAYRYQWSFVTKVPDQYRMTQRSNQVTGFVRDGVMAAQVGDYYFTFGGWRDWPESQNDVYRSKGDLSEWEKVPNAPWHPRHVFGCVKKDGKVWVLGGDNLDANWDCWNSKDGINWQKIGETNPLPVGPRIYSAYVTHKVGAKEYIYIIGGYGYKDVLRSADGAVWETVASNLKMLGTWDEPGGAGFSNAAASLDGKLYLVCGGGGTAWGGRKEIYRSADNGFTWQRMPDFAGPQRRYTNVHVWDNKIWVVGGYDETGAGNLNDVWYMTPNGTWHQVETPPAYVARHATGMAVYNNKLVITCGDYNNDCWVIEKVK